MLHCMRGRPTRQLDVRDGSLADIETLQLNVRFTPKSGHWNSLARCLLCSKSRLMHRSKDTVHSITWPAEASNDGGIVRPSALAVLRLTANSNLVGCWIGSSPGLAPFEDAVDVARCKAALFDIIVTIGDQAARSRKLGDIKISRRDTISAQVK